MEIIEDYYSETLEKEVTVVLTWYDYDVSTQYLDFEWQVQDETGKDVQDDLSGDEQDECERIARRYAKSL
jgi:uncharacterized iron-regulated protein